MSKPKVVKDWDKLAPEVIEQIKLNYPYGFDRDLIMFKNHKGKLISALPFETEERSYLIRMTREEALNVVKEDDDFDEDGNLKDEIREELEVKHGDDELVVDEE